MNGECVAWLFWWMIKKVWKIQCKRIWEEETHVRVDCSLLNNNNRTTTKNEQHGGKYQWDEKRARSRSHGASCTSQDFFINFVFVCWPTKRSNRLRICWWTKEKMRMLILNAHSSWFFVNIANIFFSLLLLLHTLWPSLCENVAQINTDAARIMLFRMRNVILMYEHRNRNRFVVSLMWFSNCMHF